MRCDYKEMARKQGQTQREEPGESANYCSLAWTCAISCSVISNFASAASVALVPLPAMLWQDRDFREHAGQVRARVLFARFSCRVLRALPLTGNRFGQDIDEPVVEQPRTWDPVQWF